MSPNEIQVVFTLLTGTLILLIMGAFIIILLLLFKHRQRKNSQEKAQLQATYEQTIYKAQLEVQNQTLQRVGQDLHDNVGQLLTLTRLYLNMTEDLLPPGPAHQKITLANDMLVQSITEVRALSKTLDSQFIENFGLVDSMTHELDRLSKTGRFTTTLHVTGEVYSLGFQREIILFRIAQELFNNIIKHANAHSLVVNMAYGTNGFSVEITDDGTGFDYEQALLKQADISGSGLRNIVHRVRLINGQCHFRSAPGTGTTVTINLVITADK